MFKRGAWLLLGLVLAANVAQARELAGVKLAEKIQDSAGKTLVLNGAGIRYKFIFKIYVAALYLPKAAHSTQAVLDEPGPKRMVMHFVYHKVTREEMQDGWTDGFSDNLSDKAYQALLPRIKQFNKLFGDLNAGDRVWLDYQPGVGTTVAIDGVKKSVVPGADFMRALLSIWLGPEPPSDDLKQELLGVETHD